MSSQNKMLRILFLLDSQFPFISGGRETGVYHIAKYGMLERKLELHCVVINPSYGKSVPVYKDVDKYCNIHSVFSWQQLAKFRGYNYFAQIIDHLNFPRRAQKACYNICDNIKFDAVVCVNAGPIGLIAMEVAKKFNCISVLNIRSFYSEELKKTESIYRHLTHKYEPIEKRVIREIDLILANGEDTYQSCRKIYNRNLPIELIHNGVDINKFQQKYDSNIRNKYGLNDHIIFISNNPLRDIKGPQDAIKAFALLSQHDRDRSRLVFIGQGLFSPYQKLADLLGVSSYVKYLGNIPHDELPEYLNSADIALHPILFSAGTTHASLETLAAGLPQIAYNSASLKSICKNGLNGFLICPGDIEALSNAMSQLINNENMRLDMSAASRELSLEYDWHKYVLKYYLSIEKIINSKSN